MALNSCGTINKLVYCYIYSTCITIISMHRTPDVGNNTLFYNNFYVFLLALVCILKPRTCSSHLKSCIAHNVQLFILM